MLILEKNGRFGTSIGPFLSGAARGTILACGSYLFAVAVTFGRDGRARADTTVAKLSHALPILQGACEAISTSLEMG